MIEIEKSVVIKKPIEEVFAYSQNIDNIPKWAGMSMQILEGSANVIGSRFLSSRTFLGKEMKVKMEVTEFKENERWAAKSIEGPVQSKMSITYAKVPEGTKVTMTGEGETKWFFKLAEGAVASSMEKSLEESLNLLKSFLESI